eukprot:TRINITY_DN4923_c0_g1_i5.p2 TRINITY_DN4923_c0_g1~~TRINITY_DN4923_c0_g1_i5.p2  ORF type:complete len:134 (+),score=12.79 TRINITY_DN4923_c0_g1_i5:771-1172(+)
MVPLRFVSGGTDGLVKHWTLNFEQQKFVPETILARPEWIRDIAFLHPDSMGLFNPEWEVRLPDTLAVCSDRMGTTILRKTTEWEKFVLPPETTSAAKLTWAVDVSNLSVMYEDGTVKMYEETTLGKWEEFNNP